MGVPCVRVCVYPSFLPRPSCISAAVCYHCLFDGTAYEETEIVKSQEATPRKEPSTVAQVIRWRAFCVALVFAVAASFGLSGAEEEEEERVP